MISLDKNVCDPNSRVADRMRLYGKEGDITILVPGYETKDVKLDGRVEAYSVSGNRARQLVRLFFLGQSVMRKKKHDRITTQDPFFTALIGVFLSKLHDTPLEIQVHGDFFSSSYFNSFFWKLKRLLAKILLTQATHVRVVSERIKQGILKQGIDPKKVIVRPVHVDIESLRKDPPISLQKDYPSFSKTFIFIGRLEPVKNIPFLIELFKAVKQAGDSYGLLIIGDGSQKKYLQELVEQNDLTSTVKFLGWVDNVGSYYTAASGLLLPSFSEAYGMVALEAQGLNCPVIMSNVGVVGYELQPGPGVVIVDNFDQQRWLSALHTV